jgi:hypothetical protein
MVALNVPTWVAALYVVAAVLGGALAYRDARTRTTAAYWNRAIGQKLATTGPTRAPVVRPSWRAGASTDTAPGTREDGGLAGPATPPLTLAADEAVPHFILEVRRLHPAAPPHDRLVPHDDPQLLEFVARAATWTADDWLAIMAVEELANRAGPPLVDLVNAEMDSALGDKGASDAARYVNFLILAAMRVFRARALAEARAADGHADGRSVADWLHVHDEWWRGGDRVVSDAVAAIVQRDILTPGTLARLWVPFEAKLGPRPVTMETLHRRAQR